MGVTFFGQFARGFGETYQLAGLIADRIDDDTRTECGAILAQAPAFGFVPSGTPRRFKRLHWHSVLAVFLAIKPREMLADDFLGGIAFDPRRAGVPVCHEAVWIEHEDGVVDYAFDKQPEAPLAFMKLSEGPRHLSGAFVDALLERLVQLL